MSVLRNLEQFFYLFLKQLLFHNTNFSAWTNNYHEKRKDSKKIVKNKKIGSRHDTILKIHRKIRAETRISLASEVASNVDSNSTWSWWAHGLPRYQGKQRMASNVVGAGKESHQNQIWCILNQAWGIIQKVASSYTVDAALRLKTLTLANNIEKCQFCADISLDI